MSADLFNCEDAKGNSLSLDMNVCGVLTVCAMAKREHEPDPGPDMVNLHFKPTKENVEVMRNLIKSITSWIEQVTVTGQQEESNGRGTEARRAVGEEG